MPTVANDVRLEYACEGRMARIVLDRPKGNVLSIETIHRIGRLLASAAANDDVRLVTLEASGPHFSYGASIEEHRPDNAARMLRALHGLIRAIASCETPVAALVQGICYGGALEVTLACHFLFVARDARLAVPEISLGVFPPAGCALLGLRANQALAERMVLSGEEISGARAFELGLAAAVFPAESLSRDVEDWFGRTLGRMSASSLRHCVRALRHSFLPKLDKRLRRAEAAYLDKLLDTHDGREGIDAFLAKRDPCWRNE